MTFAQANHYCKGRVHRLALLRMKNLRLKGGLDLSDINRELTASAYSGRKTLQKRFWRTVVYYNGLVALACFALGNAIQDAQKAALIIMVLNAGFVALALRQKPWN